MDVVGIERMEEEERSSGRATVPTALGRAGGEKVFPSNLLLD
jgi:hypothetical protein